MGEKRKGHTSASFLTSSSLPIAAEKEALLDSLIKYHTTIIVGETGSGKSTQLPQYIADLFSNRLLSIEETTGKWNFATNADQSPPKKKLQSQECNVKIKGIKAKPEPKHCIVCTQPRRVAAMTIATRVAQERGVKIGNEVGYSVRFDDQTSKETKIKFVTDGVLLREFMSDPLLMKYNVVILDEAHERSLQTDILMGLLRQLQEKRPSLRLVIMSATLQIDLFMSFFKDPNLVTIPGRQFPVTVFYTKEPEPDYMGAALLTCLQIHENSSNEEECADNVDVPDSPSENFMTDGKGMKSKKLQNFDSSRNLNGGVLVFLPGQEDIEGLMELLEEHLPRVSASGNNSIQSQAALETLKTVMTIKENKTTNDKSEEGMKEQQHVIAEIYDKNFEILPLYAALPPEEQMKAFKKSRPGVRKFVLATNIAETSVTISGISYVIDVGFVKMRSLHDITGIEALQVVPVSQSQANQRTGRAGREREGQCFRLFTEETFEALPISSVPEIQRVNIAQVILQLKVLGIANPLDFPYPSPPSQVSVRKALELLVGLGALDKSMNLTSHGRNMSCLPLDPQYAHLLLKSQDYGCVSEMLTAVSILSSESLYLQPHQEHHKRAAALCHRRFASKDGDLPTLVSIYNSWIAAKQDAVWTRDHYLSLRSLRHACSVRKQLTELLSKIGLDVNSSCLPKREPFLQALVAGLPLNVAGSFACQTFTSMFPFFLIC